MEGATDDESDRSNSECLRSSDTKHPVASNPILVSKLSCSDRRQFLLESAFGLTAAIASPPVKLTRSEVRNN